MWNFERTALGYWIACVAADRHADRLFQIAGAGTAARDDAAWAEGDLCSHGAAGAVGGARATMSSARTSFASRRGVFRAQRHYR